jgi:Ser/Thr protein kinase RdoA (MazF antagonist)
MNQQSPATARTPNSIGPPNLCAALTPLAARWFPDDSATPRTPGLTVTPLDRPGFSGSPLARVTSALGSFILKAFAVGTSPERARWIHALMAHLVAEGVREVPPVCRTPRGDTLVTDATGGLWEMIQFVPGVALAAPTLTQAAVAAAAVARLHRAAATLPPTRPTSVVPTTAVPAAVTRRREQAQQMLLHPWSDRRARIECRADELPWLTRWDRAIEIFAACSGPRSLSHVVAFDPGPLAMQPVVRDLWSDHVLFADDRQQVAGIVDFHAAAFDTPATDLARLLGSWWVGGEPTQRAAGWDSALGAYDRVRPLTAPERRLVPFLAVTGVLFALDNWFRWLLEERRSFPASAAVARRIDGLLGQLPAALESLAGGNGWPV